MGVKRNSNNLSSQFPLKIHCLIWITAIALAGLFGLPDPMLSATASGPDAPNPIIVVDPGHGGHNQGARGPAESTEKDVCLTLAQALAAALETKGYTAVLTRSADYDVPLRNRTAMANQQKADLFISIHTAASYLHSVEGIVIHHYQPPNLKSIHQPPGPGTVDVSARAWRQIQLSHEAQSRELAQTMSRTMAVIWPSTPIQVYQTPLVVLEGADMAAVLIEIGALTHPATEKNLSNQTYLTTFAQALAQSVDTYFAIKPRSRTGT